MSNSYVKMFVVGGLCLKSVFTYDQFLYVVQILKMTPQITRHTVMFHEDKFMQIMDFCIVMIAGWIVFMTQRAV